MTRRASTWTDEPRWSARDGRSPWLIALTLIAFAAGWHKIVNLGDVSRWLLADDEGIV